MKVVKSTTYHLSAEDLKTAVALLIYENTEVRDVPANDELKVTIYEVTGTAEVSHNTTSEVEIAE